VVESEDFQNLEEKLKTQQVYQPRKINHPNFKNMSHSAAIEFLQDKQVGDFVFRPSSKVPFKSQGQNFLNLTWKFYSNIIQHIQIKEEQKQAGSVLS